MADFDSSKIYETVGEIMLSLQSPTRDVVNTDLVRLLGCYESASESLLVDRCCACVCSCLTTTRLTSSK
jgi:hypothetical protein